MTDFVHMRPIPKGDCQVCSWPTDGLAVRLVKAMRASHPKGINTCIPCIDRAKLDADRKRGLR